MPRDPFYDSAFESVREKFLDDLRGIQAKARAARFPVFDFGPLATLTGSPVLSLSRYAPPDAEEPEWHAKCADGRRWRLGGLILDQIEGEPVRVSAASAWPVSEFEEPEEVM